MRLSANAVPTVTHRPGMNSDPHQRVAAAVVQKSGSGKFAALRSRFRSYDGQLGNNPKCSRGTLDSKPDCSVLPSRHYRYESESAIRQDQSSMKAEAGFFPALRFQYS